MPVYTFVAEYAGGTYVSQVRAPNPKAAVFQWARHLDIAAIPNFGPKSKDKLLRELKNDDLWDCLLVALDGLQNVWYFSKTVRGKLLLVNFVATQLP